MQDVIMWQHCMGFDVNAYMDVASDSDRFPDEYNR